MVNVGSYGAGNFLSAAQLKEFPEEERWAIVLPGAEFRESDFQGQKSTRLYIPLSLSSGEEKDYNCNKTSAKKLMDAWGNDTDNWVDKKIKFVLLSQNVRGTIRDVVYGEPFVEKEAPAS